MGMEPEVGVGLGNRQAILDAIPGPNQNSDVKGGTPAAAGIFNSLEHLKAQDNFEESESYMILVTDGAANCPMGVDPEDDFAEFEVYDENLQTLVASAFNDDGITTFVIGIDIIDALQGAGNSDGAPAANPFEELNEVAEAGGAPKDGDEKFFNATNQDELSDALEDIAAQIPSCIVPLDPPPDENQIPWVEFQVDGEDVPEVQDCLTEDGWVWVDQPNSIELCGTFCDALIESGELDGVYGCPPAG